MIRAGWLDGEPTNSAGIAPHRSSPGASTAGSPAPPGSVVLALRVARGQAAPPHWVATLSPDERERAARFRRHDDMVAFIGGRYLLRTTLATRLGTAPALVQLLVRQDGSVAVAAAPVAVQVSLSHSGELALAALAGEPVGVDVQAVGEQPSPQLVGRVCTAAEALELALADAGEGPARFARLWARKEAVVKASGGLVHLDEVGQLDVRGSSPAPRRDGDVAALRRMTLLDIDLSGGPALRCAYAAALAVTVEHPPAARRAHG